MINSMHEAPEISLTIGHNTNSANGGTPAIKKKSKWSFRSWWDTIFVAACVISISLDPLFFYIPIIDREKMCLEPDKELKTVTLILRSLMDITFAVHIIYQIRKAIRAVPPADQLAPKENSKLWSFSGWARLLSMNSTCQNKNAGAMVDNLSWPSLLTDIIALLPIPQVLLLVVFFKMRGSGYLDHRKILNLFLLAQYLAKIYRIYLSSIKLRVSHGIRIKGLFYMFLYIFASHVLGAFWYFFSIQRETSCWHRNCGHNCISSFYCDEYKDIQDMRTLISSLNQSCRIDTNGPFDFGIFLDSLKSNNTISTNFPQKLCFSFWWGLRNLSNFGTNLVTSNYIWENCFAILISIIGLLLFLYLIGNVQTFMSMETEKAEEIRRKIKSKEQDIEVWMDKNTLPGNLRKEIMTKIREKLEEDKNVGLENLFDILPWDTIKSLKRALCMSTLKKVPMLEGKDPKVLKMICDYLKHVIYPEHSDVVKVGEPADRMVVITEGTMWIYTPNASSAPNIQRTVTNGQTYGDEQLLSWLKDMQHVSYSNIPISKENVKCHTRVEGFSITAEDLKTVATKCQVYWNYDDSREKEIGNKFRRHRNQPNRPATVRQDAATPPRTQIEYLQIEKR